jgi:hypothetical protein
MIGNRKAFVTAAIRAAALGRAWAQEPQFATLDIEWENAVGYVDDLADPSKLVTSPDVVSPNPRTFMPFYGIADIVSVNGKPARGSWVLGGAVDRALSYPDAGPGNRRPW